MRLLHVIPSMDPRSGGPAEGVKRLGAELAKAGHTASVVCLDSANEVSDGSWPGELVCLGPSRGTYGFNKKLVPWLRANATNYDAVIVNGLWQYHGFATWRALKGMGVPYFVFTHGMLDPWFKQTYPLKHMKKWLYWPWAEYRLLRDAESVLFTCEEERRLARKSFWLYRANEQVVSYGTASPPMDRERVTKLFFDGYPHLRGKRLVLFLSRIHEKKGCDMLIQAFASMARTETDVQLVVAGPGDEALVARLQKLAADLGIADRVTWPGILTGDLKWGAFYAAEAFCLPSHQENFGIVVAEALACSKPVLISDKVNIWREIERDGAGIIATDTLEGTESLLSRWLTMSPEARVKMAVAARSCFENRFHVSQFAENIVHVVSKALSVNACQIARVAT